MKRIAIILLSIFALLACCWLSFKVTYTLTRRVVLDCLEETRTRDSAQPTQIDKEYDKPAWHVLAQEPPVITYSDEEQEDYENYLIEQALLQKAQRIDNCKITFYCCEKRKHICGTGDGITKSGTKVTPNYTVAVDPKVIPLGATVMIDYGDGNIQYYIAEDTGGAIKGNRIDVAVAQHEEALDLGVKYATVYWVKE